MHEVVVYVLIFLLSENKGLMSMKDVRIQVNCPNITGYESFNLGYVEEFSNLYLDIIHYLPQFIRATT